jgi:hypothetical protein
MNTILTLPDGSAIDARFVAAITWDKARGTGEYASPSCIRIFSAKSDFMMRGPQMEQTHYCPMENDAAAREACQMLVSGWTGKAAAAQPAEVQ